MVSFSSLGGSSRLAKERAEAFLRKNPKLPYTAATSVAQVLGFPYNIIPELPAVLRKLWSLPDWRDVAVSLARSGKIVVYAVMYLLFHTVCSLILKKKQVTKRAAAEIFTRSLITLGPKETASAHSWTFWVGRSATPGSICPVYTFTTVEGFWSFYNNMCQPSQLTPGFDFYFFKDNIEPKWEGEESVHAEGGKWTLSFSRGESNFPWQQTLQALVNEQFRHRHDVCGAVVNVRDEQEKISLWTKNAANENAQLSIGKQWNMGSFRASSLLRSAMVFLAVKLTASFGLVTAAMPPPPPSSFDSYCGGSCRLWSSSWLQACNVDRCYHFGEEAEVGSGTGGVEVRPSAAFFGKAELATSRWASSHSPCKKQKLGRPKGLTNNPRVESVSEN
ncbi:uncharacterized protein LOC126785829 [Argentina anserina]|uniref:uncharacterized protein LOC126785829 n=1 Tax=Argentina anserina TaxID=57926 RepID=UPI002176816E|nr:uncharacterized protein LOC126785829 [Potentilla anserina]